MLLVSIVELGLQEGVPVCFRGASRSSHPFIHPCGGPPALLVLMVVLYLVEAIFGGSGIRRVFWRIPHRRGQWTTASPHLFVAYDQKETIWRPLSVVDKGGFDRGSSQWLEP